VARPRAVRSHPPPQDLPWISPGSPLTSPGFPISPEVSGVSLCCEPHEIAHEFAHEITSSIWSDSLAPSARQSKFRYEFVKFRYEFVKFRYEFVKFRYEFVVGRSVSR
jgi:hypothetical protein